MTDLVEPVFWAYARILDHLYVLPISDRSVSFVLDKEKIEITL